MRHEIGTWSGFRPGDVVIENPGGPNPIVVERENVGPVFGTATVDGESRRGFLNSGGYFVYPIEEGTGATRHYTNFVPDPDWRAAVDAYARREHRLANILRQWKETLAGGHSKVELDLAIADIEEAMEP